MIYETLKHFKPAEVLSPDGMALMRRGICPQSHVALRKLDLFREKLGVALRCNEGGHNYRGFRSPKEQKRVYGDIPYTFHFWCAFDLVCPDLSLQELFEQAVIFGWRGVYLNHDVKIVHVDDREELIWIAEKKNGQFQLVDTGYLEGQGS